MHNHGQNHCWVTHPHLRRVTSLISFNPHPVSPPSGFSLYSSCASLHFFIPFQLSPPAHLTSNCLWNKPGPTGTRQICTNTHSYLSGSEKHHSKTKKEINKIKKQHPLTSISADCHRFARLKRREFFLHMTSVSEKAWKGTAVVFGQLTIIQTTGLTIYDLSETVIVLMTNEWTNCESIFPRTTQIQVCLRWLCCRRLQIMMR